MTKWKVSAKLKPFADEKFMDLRWIVFVFDRAEIILR